MSLTDQQIFALLPYVFGSLVLLLLVVWFVQARRSEKPKTCICPHCWTVGFPVVKLPGSTPILILLLLCFVLPGVFYALLREGFKRTGCAECGGSPMVPVHSARGAKLLLELRPE